MRRISLLTAGDPAGVGNNIILQAFLKEPKLFDDVIVITTKSILQYVMHSLNMKADINVVCSINIEQIASLRLEDIALKQGVINIIDISGIDVEPGKPNSKGGLLSLKYIDLAIRMLKKNLASAIITAPVNKAFINLYEPSFYGHTEYIAKAFNIAEDDVTMFFYSPAFCVALTTTHLPIAKLPSAITENKLIKTIKNAVSFGKVYFGGDFEIWVCGFNPHAGEGGLLGSEEIDIIKPVIDSYKDTPIVVRGPFPADTMFFNIMKEKNTKNIIAIAHYHDQGLIPLKMLYFYDSVNITLGLPFIRTSVSHGTGYDIALSHLASPQSLINAIKVARHYIEV